VQRDLTYTEGGIAPGDTLEGVTPERIRTYVYVRTCACVHALCEQAFNKATSYVRTQNTFLSL